MTLVEVNKKVEKILSQEEKESSILSDQDQINSLLDKINYFKKYLTERANEYRNLEEIFASLTWFDKIPDAQEKKIYSLIKRGLKLHRDSLIGYVRLSRIFGKLKANKSELKNFKGALDDLEDTLFEVNQILFEIRKDPEFDELFAKAG